MSTSQVPARPRPGPRVAPPQPTSSVPWAALLDRPVEEGRRGWVMSDGVLLPLGPGEVATRRSRTLAALLFRRRHAAG